MPTPLEIHAQAEVDRLELLESAARTELTAAQSELQARQAEHANALTQLAQREAEVEAVRRELGGSEVAANAEAGGEQLRAALIALRAARSDLLDAKLAMYAAQDRIAFAQAEHAGLRAALDQARGALTQMQQRTTQVEKWEAALASGSVLETLPDLATTILTGPAFTDAQAKVESPTSGLPGSLRDRARERLQAVIEDDQTAAAQLIQLEDTLDSLLAETAGLLGEVEPFERRLERAEAELEQYVNQGQRWLNEAQTRLARIATRRSLTPAEQAELESNTDREDALAAEHDYDQDRAELAGASRLRALRIAEIYADTSITNPEDAIASDSAIADLDATIASAEASIAAYEASDADELLRSWEADVPNFVWQDLLDFEIAKLLLDRLSAIVPADLLASMANAESDLADVLTRARSIDHRVAAIRALIDRVNTTLARRRETADERRDAALRGLR